MIEIERKFLVTSDTFKNLAIAKNRIVQGFLNTDPERTVRVRIIGEMAFLTVKGKGNETGVTRFEVKVGNHIFEVDEFFEDNQGLVIAEIELSSESEFFEKPDWLGEEVSGITKYYNSQLSKNPFVKWMK